MKIIRFTEEHIIAAIRSQVLDEKTVERVSRGLGISAATLLGIHFVSSVLPQRHTRTGKFLVSIGPTFQAPVS